MTADSADRAGSDVAGAPSWWRFTELRHVGCRTGNRPTAGDASTTHRLVGFAVYQWPNPVWTDPTTADLDTPAVRLSAGPVARPPGRLWSTRWSARSEWLTRAQRGVGAREVLVDGRGGGAPVAPERDPVLSRLAVHLVEWSPVYPMVPAASREHYVKPFLALPGELRRSVYTTNTI